ncbi:MAG: hypothetical protein N4A62_14895 [Marinisporobacter sp.]|jgi:hypothetical protein|nr:hypothetical protein [Marinisporobacter sp.]
MKGVRMENYMFIGALGVMIFNVCNDMYHKRRSKIVAKSLERNRVYIITSIVFFLASLIYARLFYGYKGDLINIELKYMYVAIVYGSAGLVFLIRSFQKDLINEEGICTSKGIYKWKKIIRYEWEIEEMKVKKEVIQYYNLTFFIRKNKMARFFPEIEEKEISLKINTENMEKVDQFLKELFKEKLQ